MLNPSLPKRGPARTLTGITLVHTLGQGLWVALNAIYATSVLKLSPGQFGCSPVWPSSTAPSGGWSWPSAAVGALMPPVARWADRSRHSVRTREPSTPQFLPLLRPFAFLSSGHLENQPFRHPIIPSFRFRVVRACPGPGFRRRARIPEGLRAPPGRLPGHRTVREIRSALPADLKSAIE
ncbi:hypothetical protein [Streptomyces sp. NPDC054865]